MFGRTRHDFRDRRGQTVCRVVAHDLGRCEVHTYAAWETAAPADRERAAAWLSQWYPRLSHDQRYAMLTIGRPKADDSPSHSPDGRKSGDPGGR